MESFNELYLLAKEKIINADNIAIITHINPDGDCIGSAAALRELILSFVKDASIYNENGCPASLARSCRRRNGQKEVPADMPAVRRDRAAAAGPHLVDQR